tara:strand:- start:470 stop:628 length:159 start_codon:yes stop_codon:yes gene_type:complete
MGVVEWEHNRLKQKEIEVQALVALSAHGTDYQKYNARKKLEAYAFPEEVELD